MEVICEIVRVARNLIKSHPLKPKLSAELFAQKGICDFWFSAAPIEWLQSELEGLQIILVSVYILKKQECWEGHEQTLITTIWKETKRIEELEEAGYRSPTWAVVTSSAAD